MSKKEDYLYWIKSDEDELTEEIIYRELYSRIGYIFHLVQMIEYNIANIISIEKYVKDHSVIYGSGELENVKLKINEEFEKLLKNKTFGGLIKEAKGNNSLNGFDFKELNDMKKYRDYLAHNCFKYKLMNDQLKTLEDADEFVKELNEYEIKAKKLNEKLIERFKEVKKESILIKKNDNLLNVNIILNKKENINLTN